MPSRRWTASRGRSGLPEVMRRLIWCVAVAAAIVGVLVVVDFPYATDAAPSAEETAKTIAFYQREYAAGNDAPDTTSADYVKTGEAVASAWHVEEKLRQFIEEHGLEDKKVLDIGAGRGYLQMSSAITRVWIFRPPRRGFSGNRLCSGRRRRSRFRTITSMRYGRSSFWSTFRLRSRHCSKCGVW
jgi:hypothetical protein